MENNHAGERDVVAARLAYLTVGLSTAGAVAALVLTATTGPRGTDLVALALMYTITGVGVEIGMHRYFSHRSFEAKAPLTWFLTVAASMAAQGTIVFWVAHHRLHHAYADTNLDPHSPAPIGPGWTGVLRGLWHAHMGWLFEAHSVNWSKNTRDLLADRIVMTSHRRYPLYVLAGLMLPALVAVAIDPSWRAFFGGILWGGFLRIVLLDHATWIVNSLGHLAGSRRYPTRDASRNIATLSAPTMGGSWHNNHHARPGLATTSHRWWQLDISGLIIHLFDALGVAYDVKYPRSRRQPTGTDVVDTSTATARSEKVA